MRIKRYIQFIKESKTEINFWKLTSDDILEFFIDFEDAGYDVTVELGFQSTNGDESDDDFTKKILTGNYIPSYWIQIETKSDTSSEDITESLKFAIDIIADKLNTSDTNQLSLFQSSHEDYPGKITLHDSDGEFPLRYLYDDLLKIKGGTFWKEGNDDYDYEFENYTAIFIRQKDSVNITPKMMADFNEWSYDHSDDKGNIYLDIELEDLADILLQRSDSYKEYLVGGTENMWEYYDSTHYYPDDVSLFQYNLDKDNERLLVKAIIKELGGLDETKIHIGDECDNDTYTDIKDLSEEDLITFLLKERFYDTLKQISNYSEVKQEVKGIIADHSVSAHIDDNYRSIVSEFDDIINDEFEFNKIKKEVEKSYISTDKNGEKKSHKYKENVTFYRIKFDDKWLSITEDWDDSDMRRYISDISDIFKEYTSREISGYSMNPIFSDYGSVDSKEMNSDIKYYLNRFISN